VLAFWLAYILTRPLGASIGDFMSQHDHTYGGLGLGTTGTSYIFLGCILALVTFLSVTRRDQTPPEVVLADEAAHRQPGREHHLHRPHAHLPHVEPPRKPASEEA
jgi:Na+/melibiose symporter-like transporter